MSRNYKFHNPSAPYFVSFSLVEWLDDSVNSPQTYLPEMNTKTFS
jgi:hypothetical protein